MGAQGLEHNVKDLKRFTFYVKLIDGGRNTQQEKY